MLSRTADSLYWLARYLERAENTARLLEVTHTLSLMPVSADPAAELASALEISGATELYRELHGKLASNPDADRVLHFFVFETRNPGSILSCLKAARDNAHAVRGSITAEVWESVNATWLEMGRLTPEALDDMGAGVFFDRVKERSHLFRGAAYGTMMRNDAFRFMRIGTFIERADNTARLLDFKYSRSGAYGSNGDGNAISAADYYQWTALLRALGAFEAYQAFFHDRVRADHVAELLILNPVVPRSLNACLREIADILPGIEGDSGRAAKRLAAEMSAALAWGEITPILETGVHDWLNDFLDRIDRLANAIHGGYLEAT
ncbi:MAG: alpha-E domain-containing protein [Pseudomonadota bacterium]